MLVVVDRNPAATITIPKAPEYENEPVALPKGPTHPTVDTRPENNNIFGE